MNNERYSFLVITNIYRFSSPLILKAKDCFFIIDEDLITLISHHFSLKESNIFNEQTILNL